MSRLPEPDVAPTAAAGGEQSVIVFCPTGRDSELITAALDGVGIANESCTSIAQAVDHIQEGVGLLLLAQEVLSRQAIELISAELAQQPRWSDQPIIVLGHPPHAQPGNRTLGLVDVLPNATVLDRPLRKALLMRAVDVCLRSRRRQYELRDHLQERESILEELERANTAKDEFLGLVSHELRTPASTIMGGAKLLRKLGDRLSEVDRADLLEGIDKEADRLCKMIENLLLLSKADGMDIREPLLLSRELSRAIEAFQASRPDRIIKLDADPTIGPVTCNAELFQHVIANLLSNADKYSPEAESIELVTLGVEGGAELIVRDHGPGVRADELATIFQSFYRSSATAMTARGLGLGLTVCRRLVLSQGGRIWATIADGGGLEMHCFLPYCVE